MSTRARPAQARADVGPAAAGAAVGAAVGGSNGDSVIDLPASRAAITPEEWKASFDRVIDLKTHGTQTSEASALQVHPGTYHYHFKRYIDKNVLPKGSVGAPTRLPAEAEDKLVQWIERLVTNKTPALPCQVQEKAKALAEVYDVDPDEVGGDKWLTHFLGRHPRLGKRLPQQVEQIRVFATTTTSLEVFYNNLNDVFPLYPPPKGKLHLTVNPEKVYNMDETAIMLKNMRSKVGDSLSTCARRWVTLSLSRAPTSLVREEHDLLTLYTFSPYLFPAGNRGKGQGCPGSVARTILPRDACRVRQRNGEAPTTSPHLPGRSSQVLVHQGLPRGTASHD